MSDRPANLLINRIALLYRRIPSWIVRDVILPLGVTRLAFSLVACLTLQLFHPATFFSEAWQVERDGQRHSITGHISPDQHPLVNVWSRWDAGWYLQIAKSGYSYKPGRPSSVAFFPLYPLLIRSLSTVLFFPEDDYWFLVSGILLSNLSLLIALIYFYKLVRLDSGEVTAARTILYLLVFPTSFFFSSVYAESLFLALSVTAFYQGRKNRWALACVLAGLAILCRSQGILIVLPLVLEYLQQRDFRFRRIQWNILFFLLIPAALALFPLYLQTQFGTWRVLFAAQQPWGRHLMWPWNTLSWVLRHSPPLSGAHHEWLDFSFLLLLLVGLVLGFRWLRPSYAVYGWTAAAFFCCWGMLGSVPRFDLVVFPLFIVLGSIGARSDAFHAGYLITASMMAALLMSIHSNWNWVA